MTSWQLVVVVSTPSRAWARTGSQTPARGPPSFSPHTSSSAATPTGFVHKSQTVSVVGMSGQLKRCFQIGAGLYAVGRPVQKRNDEDGQIGTIQSLPLERGALFNRFFGEPAHGPPHVAGGASGPIGGCRDESRTDNPDLDLRHVLTIGYIRHWWTC